MRKSIKVLIVDDSAWMRKIIADTLSEIPGIEVVGKARNGEVALEMIRRNAPDLVTLDLEMPVMNGLDTLKHLQQEGPEEVKVIVLSSRSDHGTTLKALENGAVDFLEKPVNMLVDQGAFKEKLECHIIALFGKKNKNEPTEKPEPLFSKQLVSSKQRGTVPASPKAIVIGASTGGPKALVDVVEQLPQKLSIPVFIVQHMPVGFTASFAERLNQVCPVPVVEAKNHMPIEPGVVYLAQGGSHMTILNGQIQLDRSPKLHGVRPAVDLLFCSAAKTYKEGLIGVILTGMGKDGTKGCEAVIQNGGYVLAQNEETSVVYGMPRSAMEAGVVDEMLGLEELSERLKRMVAK